MEMLELVTIFLITLIASATAVWFWRKITDWKGFSGTAVVHAGSRGGKKIGLQQGFISLFSAPKEKAKNIRLRNTARGIKVPWGW